MKKYIFLATAAILVLAGCKKEELINNAPVKGEGVTLSFEGTASDQTKVSIGEKDGSAYPLLWYNGDAIALYDKDTAIVNGTQAELYSGSSGQAKGVFQTVSEVKLDAATDLILTYPAASVTYDPTNKIVGTVPAKQEQHRTAASYHLGKYCVAYANTTVAAGQTEGVKFNLKQTTAFVKVVVSSSEFASAYLNSVKIWAPGKALSGKVSVDPATGVATYSDTKDYVGVTLESPSTFATDKQLYFTALPCDLSSGDVYVIFTMKDGIKTIEIPVKVTGKNMTASSLSVITVNNLKLADNTFDWYEPVETRYVANFGDGWSYGDQNTYVAVINGDAVTMDVKARGNFIFCKKPAYLLVFNACELNVSNKNNLEFNGTNAYDGEAYVKIPLNDNYTVSAKALKAGNYVGYPSKVKLLDEDSNCIWAFNIWGVTTEPAGQQMNNGIIMDRNLGAGKKDYEITDDKSRGSYYQWGRPFQTGWSSSGGLFIQTPTIVTDLSISAANPEKFYHMQDVTPSQGGDWYLGAHTGARSEHIDDLWGNQNTSGDFVVTTKGTKSIYDPCPKGWMVACPSLLNEMFKNATVNTDNSNSYRMEYTCGQEKITIPFGGCKWGSDGGNCDNNKTDLCALWSNSTITSYEQTGANAHMFYYRYKEGGWSADEKQSGNRAHGYCVRCMKDDDNR